VDERRMRGVSAELRARAKEMRHAPTAAERALWDGLRKWRIRVRRQHAVERFVLDFYVPAARLCVELDGGVHDEDGQRERDAARTEALHRMGIRVLRFRNEEVQHDLVAVIRKIEAALQV
jgi:very-short-patch-repair endonuclease